MLTFVLDEEVCFDLMNLVEGFQADAKIKQVTRDVRERGRDIEGCIKQWMSFVKPNFEKFVEPQRKVAGKNASPQKVEEEWGSNFYIDIIVPARLDNRVAIEIVVGHVKRTLNDKSRKHQEDLQRLGKQVEDEPLSENVLLLEQTREIVGMNTIISNPITTEVDFIFYFDRISSLLVER